MKRMMFKGSRYCSLVMMVWILCNSCARQEKTIDFTAKDISTVIDQMTDIMVHDITNPPLAARFFSYSLLAGYEVSAHQDTTMPAFRNRLNDYPSISFPADNKSVNTQLAALLAIMETAKKLQPSGALMDQYEKRFMDSCRQLGASDEILEQSKQYAEQISKQMLAYAKSDRYNLISNLPRYTPSNNPGSWFPTPPGFIAAVEPYFNTIRSFSLDSSSQFKPPVPIVFDSTKNSKFFQLAYAVYQEGKSSDTAHQSIASFWDCNPFIMNDKGHLQYAFKKISPGAHWLGITGIAARQANLTFNKTLEIYSVVAMGLMDGFICCWDEKYRSNRIRPETAIRRYIDPEWTPLLQTPPFPEYLSGHSTISAASSVILAHYFGDQFAYTDSVELRFGLPARSFSSFREAAKQAAISRFYGGIHFMDAIDNGFVQGEQVGRNLLVKAGISATSSY